MENKNLRNLQLCELELLKKFVKICEDNKLVYYISGGTFLGAVRHKGFIPWDDDIDVAMPRNDYEKFLKIALDNDEYIKIKNFKYSDDYIHYPTRVVDDKIKVVCKSAKKDQIWEAWIDVFPLDGVPNNFFIREIFKLNLLEKRLLLKFSCFDEIVDIKKKDRNLIEKIFIFIGKYVNFKKILNTKKRLYKLDKTLIKYSDGKSKYYMNYMGAYKFKSIMKKNEFYGEGAYYNFEGLELFGPKFYDKYLTKIYGEYMKMPSKEEMNHHNTEIVEED